MEEELRPRSFYGLTQRSIISTDNFAEDSDEDTDDLEMDFEDPIDSSGDMSDASIETVDSIELHRQRTSR